jgi:hypothetical protein
MQANEDSEGAISREQLEVGDFISTDQFVCRTGFPVVMVVRDQIVGLMVGQFKMMLLLV